MIRYDQKLKIAINGFGRIGRSILRILLEKESDFELVLINDLAPPETCAYLFKFDSVYGPWPEAVVAAKGILHVGEKEIPFYSEDDIRRVDLTQVDILLECTGQNYTKAYLQRGKEAGAQRILVSGPADAADLTMIIGANSENYRGQTIISNGSCTTNAIAPLLREIDDAFGVIGGQMTTVHCYTGSQPTVDQPREDLARSRAAALSMVPTSTSAHKLLDRVLPHLAGKIQARAIRVPTASVSAIDLTVALRNAPEVEAIYRRLKLAASGQSVLGWIDQPLVSVDLRGRPESLVIAGPGVSLAPGGLLRVFGWYDNEWGFASRMLDSCRLIGQDQYRGLS